MRKVAMENKEPWNEATHGVQPASDFKQVPKMDYDRAVSCVNALKGIVNPERWIKETNWVLDKVISFEHPEMKFGESKIMALLKFSKERDKLKQLMAIPKDQKQLSPKAIRNKIASMNENIEQLNIVINICKEDVQVLEQIIALSSKLINAQPKFIFDATMEELQGRRNKGRDATAELTKLQNRLSILQANILQTQNS